MSRGVINQGLPRGVTLTAVIITINTNKPLLVRGEKILDSTEVPDYINDDYHKIASKFMSESAIDKVFGDEVYVEKVEMDRTDLEIGRKKSLLHKHIPVRIYHWLPNYSLSALNVRVVEFVKYELFPGTSVYVNVSLGGAGRGAGDFNYATKEWRFKKAKGRERNPLEYDRLTKVFPKKSSKGKHWEEEADKLAQEFEMKI